MDGVLLDFEGLIEFVPEYQGLNKNKKSPEEKERAKKLWDFVLNKYETAKPLEGANALVNQAWNLSKGNVYILSRLPKHHTNIMKFKKMLWLFDNISSYDVVRPIFTREPKESFRQNKDDILIDDRIENLESWKGKTLLHNRDKPMSRTIQDLNNLIGK